MTDPKAVAALAEALRAMARDTGWTLVLSQGTSWEAVAAVVAARLPHGWRLEQAAEGERCPDCGLTAKRIGQVHINAQVAARPSPEPSASHDKHPLTCDWCDWGREPANYDSEAFRDHMATEHPGLPYDKPLPRPEPSASGLREDELIPLLTSCTYDMPHVTDDDRRVLAYRLAHSPLRFASPEPTREEGLDVERLARALTTIHAGPRPWPTAMTSTQLATRLAAEYARLSTPTTEEPPNASLSEPSAPCPTCKGSGIDPLAGFRVREGDPAAVLPAFDVTGAFRPSPEPSASGLREALAAVRDFWRGRPDLAPGIRLREQVRKALAATEAPGE